MAASASLYLLSVPASQTVTHGDRRFAIAAANLLVSVARFSEDSEDTAAVQHTFKNKSVE